MSFRIDEHNDVFATRLNNTRSVWVYLPPGYEKETSRRYPVLYAHDGNNLFFPSIAFAGVAWELDKTADELIEQGKISKIIIVGVANTVQREAEYTHVPHAGIGGGDAELYADFLIRDLKPFVDRTYRTRPGRGSTAIMGSSLGGLVSIYLGWKYHHVFSMSAALSPSIWWANRHIISLVEQSNEKPPIRVWLDMGTLEGPKRRTKDGSKIALRDARRMRDSLLEKGFSLDADLAYREIEGARHNEAYWGRRSGDILSYFFGTVDANLDTRQALNRGYRLAQRLRSA